MDDRFEFRGIDLPIFNDEYNTTVLNERAIEIPIAMWWLNEYSGGEGLEVGNVLRHYFPEVEPGRRIVDRYEESDDTVENIDVFDIEGGFDYIFAISTIEHVRWDPPEERDLWMAVAAVDHLYRLLRPNGRMLITIPFGSHPGLDAHILDPHGSWGWLERETVMLRNGGLWYETVASGRWECKGSSWHQAESIWWERYGKSTPWADAVWIGEFVK